MFHMQTGATEMNPESSRSHSIFTIRIESSDADEKTGKVFYKLGKLNMVDLAGACVCVCVCVSMVIHVSMGVCVCVSPFQSSCMCGTEDVI